MGGDRPWGTCGVWIRLQTILRPLSTMVHEIVYTVSRRMRGLARSSSRHGISNEHDMHADKKQHKNVLPQAALRLMHEEKVGQPLGGHDGRWANQLALAKHVSMWLFHAIRASRQQLFLRRMLVFLAATDYRSPRASDAPSNRIHAVVTYCL